MICNMQRLTVKVTDQTPIIKINGNPAQSGQLMVQFIDPIQHLYDLIDWQCPKTIACVSEKFASEPATVRLISPDGFYQFASSIVDMPQQGQDDAENMITGDAGGVFSFRKTGGLCRQYNMKFMCLPMR